MDENKMLVCRAMDVRGLTQKKIEEKVRNFEAIDYRKRNETTGAITRKTDSAFAEEAKADLQQIRDLIRYYFKLDAKIIESNLATKVETSFGKISVAVALSLRARLQNDNLMSMKGIMTNFEYMLEKNLKSQYQDILKEENERNRKVETQAESMRVALFGSDSMKGKTDENSLAVVEAFINQNKIVLMDPLNIKDLMEELSEKRQKQLSELDSAIKISNATTYIIMD